MRSFAQSHRVAATAVVAGLAFVLGALSACANPAGDATALSSAEPTATTQPDATTSGAPTSSAPALASTGGPVILPPSIKTITVMRSGGFAGLQQTLTITADGSWTFVDKRANLPTTSGRLSPGQLEQLTAWVGDPAFAAEARLPGPTGTCYDGITYTITVDEFSAKYERCGNAAARPLTDKILALLVDATAL